MYCCCMVMGPSYSCQGGYVFTCAGSCACLLVQDFGIDLGWILDAGVLVSLML